MAAFSPSTWSRVQASGLRMAYIGAESGSDAVLRAMKKGSRVAHTIEVAADPAASILTMIGARSPRCAGSSRGSRDGSRGECCLPQPYRHSRPIGRLLFLPLTRCKQSTSRIPHRSAVTFSLPAGRLCLSPQDSHPFVFNNLQARHGVCFCLGWHTASFPVVRMLCRHEHPVVFVCLKGGAR